MGEKGLGFAPKALIAGAVLLGACTTGPVAETAPPAAYAVPAAPARAYAAISTEPPDRCGASAVAWLVGRPKSEIPVPADLSNRRVQCTACNRGQAIVPQRLNIYFNPDTGLVEQVQCG